MSQNSSVLVPKILAKSSFYTNGHYLVILIPPPLASEYNYDSKVWICRTFSLLDGTFQGNTVVDHPVGLACCYDYKNNFIWNYSKASAQITFYSNAGFAPNHKSLSLARSISSLQLFNTILPEQDNQPVNSTEFAAALLSILGRLASETMPSKLHPVNRLSSHLNLKQPFCIEPTRETFTHLKSLLDFWYRRLSNTKQEVGEDEDILDKSRCLEIILHIIRILKINLYCLAVKINFDSKLDIGLAEIVQQLKQLLLDFITDQANIGSWSDHSAIELLQNEAGQAFIVGIDLFYSTAKEQAQLIVDMLKSSSRGSLVPLLDPLLNFYAEKPNCSELVVSDQGPFDPNEIFSPIVHHLIENTFHSNTNNANHNQIRSISTARLLTAMQKDLLIRAAQTIAPNNNCAEQQNTLKAIVIYSSFMFQRYEDILEHALLQSSDQFEILDTNLKEVQYSVIGSLFSSLLPSLLLFSHHIWLAQELLSPTIQLISILDKVNRRYTELPQLLQKNEQHQRQQQQQQRQAAHKKHQKSFGESQSRIVESLHPYVGGQSNSVVVTIPNAVFLSILFDEQCSTSPNDYLQLYQDQQRTKPIGDSCYGTSSRWPKHRILVPGDSVVFALQKWQFED